MIELQSMTLAGQPILHAFPTGKATAPLPCVVFYHGFTSSGLVYSYFAVALAQAGFRVVMPDAPDHGARFSGHTQERLLRFWHILQQSLEEFASLRDALLAQGWIDDDRLAVAGASMGGMTALGIMARHPEVRCVASLMGSGSFSELSRTLFPPEDAARKTVMAQLAGDEPFRRLARLADRPLLLWHGDADDVVPAAESFRLQQALQQAGLDANLTCEWQAGVRHRITPEALGCAVDFLRRHL
ncbi:MAG TPA: esterase [Enterobacteriaceae bacterium]|nr:esterase [Enterobacteriaceae bacterium]